MRKLINKYLIAILIFTGVSCDSILDINPKNTITPEIALEGIDGYEALVFSVYRDLHRFNYFGQNQNLAPDALADNLVIANNTGRYTGHVVNAVGTHMNRWDRYTAINWANIVIAGVDGVEATQELKNQLKGEALFLRALSYHDLHKVHSYEPGKEVNGFNLGVILRTTPTNGLSEADFRARSTNLEGYMQMEASLLEAISLLPSEGATTNFPHRASKTAAKALLARLYLYWGKYADAENYADQVIAETSINLLDGTNYEDAWSATKHPESLFELNIQSVDWSTVDGVNNSMNSVSAKHDQNYDETGGQFSVGGSDELINSFEAGDIRRNLWVDFGGNWENRKWQGELGDYRENIPVIRLSEIYLISAEAKARKGGADAAAQNRINELRANRDLGNTTATGQALVDLIMNERRVELCFEGHRWFDLKRNGMDISKTADSGVSPIPYSDFRILAKIPSDQVFLNSLLEQNPNY